jgi:hypothetical protein
MSYLSQNVYMAVRALGCSGKTLKERLKASYRELDRGLYQTVPSDMSEFKKVLKELEGIFKKLPAQEPYAFFDSITVSVNAMSNREKREAAEKICSLVLLLPNDGETK